MSEMQADIRKPRGLQQQGETQMSQVAEETLTKILAILEENYPSPNDLEAHYTDSKDIPASSLLTVKIGVEKGFKVRLKHVYADAMSKCDYLWIFPSGAEIIGNEAEFSMYHTLEGDDIITLMITNNDVIAKEGLDIFVEGYGRKRA